MGFSFYTPRDFPFTQLAMESYNNTVVGFCAKPNPDPSVGVVKNTLCDTIMIWCVLSLFLYGYAVGIPLISPWVYPFSS